MEEIPGGSGYEQLNYTRKELFLMMQNYLSKDFDMNLQHLENRLTEQRKCPTTIPASAKAAFSLFFSKLRMKWLASSRNSEFFLSKYDVWLNISMTFPIHGTNTKNPVKRGAGGRPFAKFTVSSDRTKRRKTAELRATNDISVLSYATQMSLRSAGQLDVSRVVKDVASTSPTRASKYRASFDAKTEITLSADEALSVIVEAKLTKHQYKLIRSTAKDKNCKLYPNYEIVREAKMRCYPPRLDIRITESTAEVSLQSLLDHTTKRILVVQQKIIKNLVPEDVNILHFILKWGCDGSSNQSEYKQKFNDDSDSDANIFLTSLVPLQLVSSESESKKKIVIWKNPRPSSPRFCRPIKLQFLHENAESTVNEIKHIEQQIETLVPLTTVLDGRDISIKYKMIFTMIDGKVCNAVSSTLRCYLCGATSKDFNNIDVILQKEINESNLQFGMSTLHAWIRFFECLLHLSYKRTIGKWQARSAEEKKIVAERKISIQKGFKSQLGLLVDRPKPGYGSTNDGNTARRFFENSSVSALITGLDVDLINRFHVILQTVSSGYEINVDKFRDFAIETARIFVQKYPWYYMPTTVHKLLIHGPTIISSALLPIGELSEEAQEARNKDVKKYRKGFSRKCSRIKTMEDVFNWLMVSSDPHISSMRKLPRKKIRQLSTETIRLLACPTIEAESEHDSNQRVSDSDSE